MPDTNIADSATTSRALMMAAPCWFACGGWFGCLPAALVVSWLVCLVGAFVCALAALAFPWLVCLVGAFVCVLAALAFP
ncbi:hypothetical protein [Paraburkholderia phytofirmans]|uniref:hypothetical protein n=1 Tax=Paraburkholderia phytofirmans TaxID=261302 RepID=UPI001396727B|nr:hypothetical protein [Paraburkholderia phytofirmans]